nr:histidine kinase [Verminephrobacter aporrectodeae]
MTPDAIDQLLRKAGGPRGSAMGIDWLNALRRFLQTIAFCLIIAAIQYAFRPEMGYGIPLRYSLAIGMLTWALIYFGHHLFPSSAGRGWPTGIAGILLPVAGTILGYLGGVQLADWWCGWSTWDVAARAQLRISIGISLLASITGIYYFYNNGRNAWMQARMAETHAQATEARLRLLETQLEPHMLFNTLANLRVLIDTDPARAQEMLDRMIAYLHATLGASRGTEHPLANEFGRLHDYLELMAVRMGSRLSYTLDLPEALRDTPVPPLLLQPLVENAIRHGIEPRVEGGHVSVRASTCPGPQLLIEVHDSGAGLPTPIPAQGFGLAQVRERLSTLHGTAGTLDLLASRAGGTCASVRFPLNPAPAPSTRPR